ncbi:MAG: cation:proton antiporter [Planctomycetota bacterium]|jgi:Kef-type K+ transport system membrane component KefB|nr:cation:proton antiporter [Planctomycetota bacterium]
MSGSDFVMLIVGVSAFAGILGAWLFQKLRIPQVVGYIVIGVLAGDSGCGFIHGQHIEALRSFNLLALGVIGFLVGGELKISEFRRYIRQYMAMMLGAGLGSFALVGISTGAIVYSVSHSLPAALAAGLVLGAIATATDPASTIDVFWEYRCRGKFTTAVVAIIALDAALSMTLYSLSKGAAQILTGHGGAIAVELIAVGKELLGAILLGALVGGCLAKILRRLAQKERKLAISIGVILLVVGVAAALDFDVILAAMTAGFTVINLEPRRSAEVFGLLRSFSIPIYVLFFVLIGAGLNVAQTPAWVWGAVVAYVVCRTFGKCCGLYLGARFSGAPTTVRRYGGWALFTQGGVAVGLTIMASEHLRDAMITESLSLSQMIIITVTATTLIVQLIGPPFAKYAADKAGEIGKSITEEDILADWTVADALIGRTAPAVRDDEPVENLIRKFAGGEFTTLPVMNRDGQAVGTVSLAGMREILTDQSCWRWLLVADAMQALGNDKLYPTTKLNAAMEMLGGSPNGELLALQENGAPFGILSERLVRQLVAEELLANYRRDENGTGGT